MSGGTQRSGYLLLTIARQSCHIIIMSNHSRRTVARRSHVDGTIMALLYSYTISPFHFWYPSCLHFQRNSNWTSPATHSHIQPVTGHQVWTGGGKLPEALLMANIALIFMKGNKNLSFACIFCKVLEHIICKHIQRHLERQNILTILQHGFIIGYLCETQLIATLQDLMQFRNKKS